MTLNRRDFVATVGLSLVGSAASRAATAAEPAAVPAIDASSDWAAVRAQFDLAPDWLHFSQFYIVSHPTPVRQAIERYRRMLDTHPFSTVEHGMGFDAFLGEGSRQEPFPVRVQRAAASYIGGRPEEVALTDSTTQGLALIYHGPDAQAGRRDPLHDARPLRASRGDPARGREVRRELAARAAVRRARGRLRGRDGRSPPARDRPATRAVVGLTWVHSSSGVQIPVRALAQAVADANRGRGEQERILVVLDAVHGFGNQAEELAQLGVDFAAAGTHKWIFAPRGTGILWVPEKNWGRLKPTIPTFYDIEPYAAWEDERSPKAPTSLSWISPGGFKAFEHQWAMAEAFEFHEQIGRARIADRIAALNSQCKEGLAKIPGVKVLTPMDPALSAGLIAFEVEGQRAGESVHKLHERKVVASTSPYKISKARLAPSLVNDEREVEAALRAVREIA